jgi:pteridine reductase
MNQPPDVALITGAARRVGRAIALELARAGFDVAVHYRSSAGDAEQTSADIASIGRRCVIIQADLADPAAPDRLVQQTVQELGSLGVLVNNASLWESSRLDEMTRATWQAHIDVNLTAPAMLAQTAWPHLRKRPPGHVINLCDVAAERPWADYVAYCASKGGLVTLTRALAKAMAPDVCVNGVSPGVVMLPEDCDERTRRAALARVPMKREGSPDDVAATVRFLVEHGGYITGQILNVDGGRSIA